MLLCRELGMCLVLITTQMQFYKLYTFSMEIVVRGKNGMDLLKCHSTEIKDTQMQMEML